MEKSQCDVKNKTQNWTMEVIQNLFFFFKEEKNE